MTLSVPAFRRCAVFALALAVLGLLQPAARAATTGFNQTGAGPYDFNTTANWVGGLINDTWDTSLTLTAAQNVTVGAATTLTNGLVFNYAGNYALVLDSSSATAQTLTLGSNLTVNTTGGTAANVTIGNPSFPLNVSLNGVTNTFTVAASRTLYFTNCLISNGAIVKNGAGTAIFYTTNTVARNPYAGGTTINTGLLSCAFFPFGLGAGPVTINLGGTLQIQRGLDVPITNALTLNGGTLLCSGGYSDVIWSGPVALTATSTIAVGDGYGLISGNISGAGALNITNYSTSSSDILILGGTNTFTGPVTIMSGNSGGQKFGGGLQVGSFNSVNGGTPASNLGAPTNVANGTISLGATNESATLIYTGPGETTDRVLKLAGTTGGAILVQSGIAGLSTARGQSGLLNFTGNFSIPGVAGVDNRKTLILTNSVVSASAGVGELSGSLGNSLAGLAGETATSLTMMGSGQWTGMGTWILAGTNTYSGPTLVLGGVLVCTGSGALGTNSVGITNGAILELDYAGTRQVSSLTLNGVTQPNGTYGSASSIAANKNNTYFAGIGTLTVGPFAVPTTTNTLALTTGSNPSSAGASLTYTATVTGGATPSGNVVFYDGLTALATNALNGSFQASFSTSLFTGAVHSVTALYLGNASNTPSASPIWYQTVTESRPGTTTAVALTGGTNPATLGSALTFTATVTGATPTGTVNFYDGTTLLTSGALTGSATASFTTASLAPGWHGIMASYVGDSNNAPSLTASPCWQTVKPGPGNGKLKVFILAGQSNMQGKGSVENGRDPNNTNSTTLIGGLGSLRHMLNANTNAYAYLEVPGRPTTNGNPGWLVMTNVWVTYWSYPSVPPTTEEHKGYLDAGDFGDNAEGNVIGPEYGFGLVVGSQFSDPVLIIKTAWGGTSLAVDWRPPSSGGTTGVCYTNMMGIVSNVLANLPAEFTNFSYSGNYEIIGFGWHQGYNDRINASYALQYETNMANFIHDVRTNFGLPNLPFVIANTAMSDAMGSLDSQIVMTSQAAMANPVLHPEFGGTVATVDCRPFDYGVYLGCSSQDYHWYFNAQSYFNIGQCLGLTMMQLLATPPTITNLPASGITATSAVLNATAAWPYVPAVASAWWNTANDGTNAAAWINSVAAGAWTNTITTNEYGLPGPYLLAGGTWTNVVATNLARTITGLTPATTYYFNFRATNNTVSDLSVTNVQVLWAANVQSFTTPAAPVTPPVPVLPPGGVMVSNGVPAFTFTAAAGCMYRLDYKNTLTDAAWSYESWVTNAAGSNQPMTLTDLGTAGQPQRYYRIEAAATP